MRCGFALRAVFLQKWPFRVRAPGICDRLAFPLLLAQPVRPASRYHAGMLAPCPTHAAPVRIERRSMNVRRTATAALAAALSLYSLTGVPVAAHADTADELQTQLDAANRELDAIYERASELNEQLNGTKVQLERTTQAIEQAEQDIADQTEKLAEAQDVLAERTAADYKYGGTSILAVVLGSSSFEQLVTRVTYASKLAASDAQAIGDVRTLKGSLEETKLGLEQDRTSQQELLEAQQQQQSELTAQAERAEAYVDSLDERVREAMEAEREAARAEAERQAREEAARREEEGGDQERPTPSVPSDGGGAQEPAVTPDAPADNPADEPQQPTSSQRQAIVSAALSMVGGSYVWGANNPAAREFDCSGLVQYCYAQVGISLDHYSESQAKWCTKPATVANARPGDIVWRKGHVGIYIGEGKTVEAHSVSEGIGWGKLSKFNRCGSPLA